MFVGEATAAKPAAVEAIKAGLASAVYWADGCAGDLLISPLSLPLIKAGLAAAVYWADGCAGDLLICHPLAFCHGGETRRKKRSNFKK